MKQLFTFCCCVLLSLALLLSACSPAASFIEADTPSFPGLTWGMSKEEAFEALGVTEEDSKETVEVSNVPMDSYVVESYRVAGNTVSIALLFPSDEWVEETGLDLGLVRVHMRCDSETGAHIANEMDQGGYSVEESQMGKTWSGKNSSYQAFTEKGLWDAIQPILITLHGLDGADLADIRGLESPEKAVTETAKSNSLSVLSSIDLSEESNLYAFEYNGLYAAVLALAEKQQTAE